MPSLTVKLPPGLEAFVAAQVRARAYPSREAAIIAAVAREKHRVEQRTRLRAQLQEGVASGMAGTLDIADVTRRGRARQAVDQRRGRD